MVPPTSHKVPRVSWYSGSCRPGCDFMYGAFTLSGWLSQNHSSTHRQSFMRSEPRGARTPVWALPVSLAATPGIDLSFSSSGYLDVSVRRVPPVNLWIQLTVTKVCLVGFPHSDICGSLDICSLPQLFAAYHVFRRLLVPRHPPCALSSLTSLRQAKQVPFLANDLVSSFLIPPCIALHVEVSGFSIYFYISL